MRKRRVRANGRMNRWEGPREDGIPGQSRSQAEDLAQLQFFEVVSYSHLWNPELS